MKTLVVVVAFQILSSYLRLGPSILDDAEYFHYCRKSYETELFGVQSQMF